MLSKDEIKQIKDISVQTFADFFRETLAPYFDQKFAEIDKRFDENKKEHEEIFRRFEENEKDHQKMFEEISDIKYIVNNHEKRITKLETKILPQ